MSSVTIIGKVSGVHVGKPAMEMRAHAPNQALNPTVKVLQYEKHNERFITPGDSEETL